MFTVGPAVARTGCSPSRRARPWTVSPNGLSGSSRGVPARRWSKNKQIKIANLDARVGQEEQVDTQLPSTSASQPGISLPGMRLRVGEPCLPPRGGRPGPLGARGLMRTWILSCSRGQAVPGGLHQESCAPASGRGCPVDPHPSQAPTLGPGSRPCTHPGRSLGELHGGSELWPVASEPSQKARSGGGQGEATHSGNIQPCLWKAKGGQSAGG